MMTAAMKLKDSFFGRKAVTNLDSILKSRDVTFMTKVHRVKDMVFSVVMYGCKSWTMKKAECGRIELLNCGVGLKLLDCKEIQPVHPGGNQS